MARYLDVMRQKAYDEEEYQKDAWNEILDEHNWYRKINENGDHSYNNIKVVKDGVTKPSEADFNAKVQELKDAYASAEYKRKRRSEYPSWQKQLEKIYDDGIDAWKTDMIDPIKAKYPKP
tara:strand:+ start:160 stop:519 length:360 start_codon:yes stop_codon:yes gene_type:complete